MGRELFSLRPQTAILGEVELWRSPVKWGLRLVASVLALAKRQVIALFHSSVASILFSFGILRVLGLLTCQLVGALGLGFIVPALVFAPIFPVLSVLIIACLLIFSIRDR